MESRAARRRPLRPLRALRAALALLALARAAPAQERIHRTYTVDDGLVQSQVLTLFEDRDGYLWFGTVDGVSRFDGVAFTNFQAPAGPPAGPVNAIAQAADGALFFGTDRGVGIYSGGRWSVPPAASGLATGPVPAIARAPDGSLFFASQGRGPVARRQDGHFVGLPLPGVPGRLQIASLLAARDGALWMGTRGAGLWTLRNGRWTAVPGVPGWSVSALAEGRDGAVYVGTDAGIAVCRGGTAAPLRGWPATVVRALALGSDGILYAGTLGQGLWLGRPSGAPERIGAGNGLPGEEVYDVRETRGGAIYVGTDRGVSFYDRGWLTNWTLASGLPDSRIWAFAGEKTAAGERVWVGTSDGLAAIEDGRLTVLGRAAGLPAGRVHTLWASPSGRLYAGTRTGVAIVESGRVVRTLGVADGLASRSVPAIREGPDGTVYFATLNGLSIWRGGRFTHLGERDGLPSPAVTSLALAPDGALFLGTAVWSVTLGPDGAVYAGTVRGLSVLRDGRFTTFDTRSGLTNNNIVCTVLDGAGRVYVSTNRGVNVLDPRAPPGRPAVLRTLRRADGLAGDEGDLGACYRDAQGRLWFGTIAGASVYDPAREPPPPAPPRVHIAGLQLFGRDLPLPPSGTTRALASRDNYLTFSFVGIDLGAPHRVRYLYRLRGLDRGFIETDRRSVQYTNLAPGDYRFEVQAASGLGPWSPAAVLAFDVLTPLWRRWWFLLLAALAVGMPVALLLTARVRQYLAIERLRTAIAADLHDHIGAGLTEISILSEIAARRATGNGSGHGSPKAAPELGKVAEIARHLVDRMDDIVWLINPRRDSLHELFLRLKDSYAELFAGSGILFKTTDLRLFEDIHLPMDYRENLYLIFKEALNNSLRHSGCREIELGVTVAGKRLEVRLAHDGRGFDSGGFDSAQGHGGDGLANMHRRAERMGGRLAIASAPATGTEVRFSGPLRRRHPRHAHR
jgi:ligand-binding sensor domain-containing protein/signal transduction histidine kinase